MLPSNDVFTSDGAPLNLTFFFFQVMDDNRPWLDMAHVVSNLNKLDAGVTDKIRLI